MLKCRCGAKFQIQVTRCPFCGFEEKRKKPDNKPLRAIYCGLYPTMLFNAQQNGWALAVHGSLSRDFDVIAIPWNKEAVSTLEIIKILIHSLDHMRDDLYSVSDLLKDPHFEKKDYGRIAVNIPLVSGFYVDLSVIDMGDET